MLDREQIEAILPHREPFLWLDRVVELIPGECHGGERIGKGEAKAFVGSDVASSGTLTFAVVEP